jgi:hypothetical protein
MLNGFARRVGLRDIGFRAAALLCEVQMEEKTNCRSQLLLIRSYAGSQSRKRKVSISLIRQN